MEVLWEQSDILGIHGDINFWRRRGQERMVLDGSSAVIFIGSNLPSPTREHTAKFGDIFGFCNWDSATGTGEKTGCYLTFYNAGDRTPAEDYPA